MTTLLLFSSEPHHSRQRFPSYNYVGLMLLLLSCNYSRRHIGVYGFSGAALRLERCRAFTKTTTSVVKSTLAADNTQSPLIQQLPKKYCRTWLDVPLPEGRCVGVTITTDDDSEEDPDAMTPENILANPNHWVHSIYHPDEVSYAMNLYAASSKSFWMGRLAMRVALGFPDYAILKDSYGRPQLAPGIYGSISHKKDCGVALVSEIMTSNNNTTLAGVGVDIELTSRPGKRSIAPRVLTKKEREELGRIPGITPDEEVLLRFSLKEAIYKAAHPLLCQYVSFQEAEVTPHPDGTATCEWFLESRADARIARLTAHWRKLDGDGFFLTSASVHQH